MNIEPIVATSFRLTQLTGLDPIDVHLQDLGGGRGKITIECFGESWSTYFGAYSGAALISFLRGVTADYLAKRLWPQSWPRNRNTKRQEEYLERIAGAVLQSLSLPMPLLNRQALPADVAGVHT